MSARAGQCCWAWAVRRWRRLTLVDSGGGLGTISDTALPGRRVAAEGGHGVWQNGPVPVSTPYQIVLSAGERAVLAALCRPTAQARMVLRAKIVLAAADGGSNAGIARELGVCPDTVRKWRPLPAGRAGRAG